MPPSAVDGVILPGWMEKEFAIKYLTEDCVFDVPITDEKAEEVWATYRNRVETMPERDALAPARLPLTAEDEEARNKFLHFHRNQGPGGSIRDVIKINPMGLVVYQFYVVLDRVNQYSQHATAKTWASRNCLSTDTQQYQLPTQAGLNILKFDVPHGEFAVAFNPATSRYGVLELARHVSVTEVQNRMILWAGYHRSYARIASENPDGMERSMLVALTTDADFFVSAQSPNQGLRAMVCGRRPPLFADFFDERFFMKVKLRKKRYELQVRAQCVPVNFD